MDDVVIVGAGPAGATAARTLTLAGARVTLLDRATFPRNKPCGGAISMRALGRFPYLRDAIRSIDTRLISRLHLESPSGEAVDLTSAEPAALMIRRIAFDRMLVRLAQDAGAELREGVEITQAEQVNGGVVLTQRNGTRLRAGIVIAADGANSVVAKRVGINPRWPPASVALDMMEETPFETLSCADPDSLWVAYGYKKSQGYAYVFPKDRHVNVGIGYVLEHYRSVIGTRPYDLQRRFVDALRGQGILQGDSARQHFTPALIPVGGPLRRAVAGRVLFAGDAGGFVNGFSAEGIYYAMVSGDLAAQSIAAGAPASYDRAWRREIGAELRDSVLVQRFLFRNPGRIDKLVRGARRHRQLADAVVRYASGGESYRAVRRRLFLKCPAVLMAILFDGQVRAPSVTISHPESR
jgi:geranylgeranyl reductase family protein